MLVFDCDDVEGCWYIWLFCYGECGEIFVENVYCKIGEKGGKIMVKEKICICLKVYDYRIFD